MDLDSLSNLQADIDSYDEVWKAKIVRVRKALYTLRSELAGLPALNSLDMCKDVEDSQTDEELYNVILHSYGTRPIPCIQLVKILTGKGLAEAKGIVCGDMPVTLKYNMSHQDAKIVQEKFVAAGSKLEINLQRHRV